MIPDEAVEVAADLVLRMIMEKPLVSANPLERELALRQGRLILEAAAPYIKAQALYKAASDAEGLGMGEIPVNALRHRADCYGISGGRS